MSQTSYPSASQPSQAKGKTQAAGAAAPSAGKAPKAAPAPANGHVHSSVSSEEIAKRAYEKFVARGGAHGGVHMPFQSIYPFFAGIGVLIGAIGIAVIDPNPDPHVIVGTKLALRVGTVVACQRHGQHGQRRELGGERLGRGDADFRTSAREHHQLGLAHQ